MCQLISNSYDVQQSNETPTLMQNKLLANHFNYQWWEYAVKKKSTSPINDIFPPWLVLVGMCWGTIIIIIITMILIEESEQCWQVVGP